MGKIQFAEVSYTGRNPLVKKILFSYDTVITGSDPPLSKAGEDWILAISGAALYDLGVKWLQTGIQRDKSASVLGIKDPEIDSAKPHLYDAVRFVCTQVLERWYGALRLRGFNADKLLEAAKNIEEGKLSTATDIVELVNTFVEPVNVMLDLNGVRPLGGYASLEEQIKSEARVRKGIIRIGQYA